MNFLKPRPFPNKIPFWFLLFLAFYFAGCVAQRSLSPEGKFTIQPAPDYAQLVESYSQCRGKGTVISQGALKGQLTFSFTSKGDSTFLLFKDMLGRKTLFISLLENDLIAWDILQNHIYTNTDLQDQFPLIAWLTPLEFTIMLWGIVPTTLRDKDGEFNFERSSQRVSLIAETGSQGSLIQRIAFENPNEGVKMTINIATREFGEAYPQLVQIGSRFLTDLNP